MCPHLARHVGYSTINGGSPERSRGYPVGWLAMTWWLWVVGGLAVVCTPLVLACVVAGARPVPSIDDEVEVEQ